MECLQKRFSCFLISVYRHLFSLSPCVRVCMRVSVCGADAEHMCSSKGRADEGIPSSHQVQVCLSDKFATHVWKVCMCVCVCVSVRVCVRT